MSPSLQHPVFPIFFIFFSLDVYKQDKYRESHGNKSNIHIFHIRKDYFLTIASWLMHLNLYKMRTTSDNLVDILLSLHRRGYGHQEVCTFIFDLNYIENMSNFQFYWPWFLSVNVAWWKDFRGRYLPCKRQAFLMVFLCLILLIVGYVRMWLDNQKKEKNYCFLSETTILQMMHILNPYAFVYTDISFNATFDCSLLSGAVVDLFLVISSMLLKRNISPFLFHLFLLWFPCGLCVATTVASALSLETRGTFFLSYA